MTLKELIARIRVTAIEAGGSPEPFLDNSVLTEVILPRCMDVVAEKAAKTPDGLQALLREVELLIITGFVALPDTVREEHLVTSSIIEDGAASYVPGWQEYIDDPQGTVPADFGRFTVRNGTFYYRPVGMDALGVAAFSGTVTLNTLVRPRLPTLITDQVVIRDSLLQQLIMLAAGVVSGQVPLREVGLDYSSLEEVRKRAELSD